MKFAFSQILLASLVLVVPLGVAEKSDAAPELAFVTSVGPRWAAVEDAALGPDGAIYVVGAGLRPGTTGERWWFDEWIPFVAKLSSEDGKVQLLTFIGEGYVGRAKAVAVGADGSVYVAGTTTAPELGATEGEYRAPNFCAEEEGEISCSGVFVAKLDPSGSRILYAALLGGSSWELVTDLAVDSAGAAYVTGPTMSSDFPVTAFATQKSNHSAPWATDIFIAKIQPGGSVLGYSTYLGGNGWDVPLGAAVNVDGQLLVAMASDGATVIGGADVTRKTYIVQVGGLGEFASVVAQLEAETEPRSLSRGFALGADGSAYVLGEAADRTCGLGFGRYVWKKPLRGQGREYLRCLDFVATDLAVDRRGRAVVAAVAWKEFGVPLTPDAVRSCVNGDRDAAVVRLDEDGEIDFGSFLGGSGIEESSVVAASPTNDLYVAMVTDSLDFPPTGDDEEGRHGIAVAKLDFDVRRRAGIQCAANAASWQAAAISPGEVLSLTGWGLGPREPLGLELDETGRVSTERGGTRILFDGVAAPLLYVSDRQVNTVAPFGLTPGKVIELQLERHGRVEARHPVLVVPFAPGVFTLSGTNRVAALNEDGTLNSPSNPAKRGSVITIYATGLGPTEPPSTDGSITHGEPLPELQYLPSVRIYGRSAEILYAGGAPGSIAGVVQINLRVPLDTSASPNATVLIRTQPHFAQSQFPLPTIAVE